MTNQTGISINLPDINVEAITNLQEAKKIITLLLNIIEQQAKQITILEKKIILLEKEIAILKQQPRKPEFERPQNTSFSASKLLKKDKKWHKSSKKGSIEIDQDVSLPEVDRCVCGSTEFATVQTTTKIIQGMLIKRNNTAYHGRKKKCTNCGRIYMTNIPEDVKGLSFDSDTQTLASFLKFACRFTHPLLYRFYTGFGMKISYGELTEILHRNSRRLHPAYSHLRNVGIKQSSYIQSDATGIKRKQLTTNEIMNQHLHFVGNKFLSLFRITKLYNAEVMNGLLGRHGRRKLYLVR